MKHLRSYITVCIVGWLACIALVGCSEANCPLNNSVYATWSFYKEDQLYKLNDTLNIYLQVNGQDSLVANRLNNVSYIGIPMSYYNSADTLTFEVKTSSHRVYKDIVIVHKENVPHFNSPECGAWVEHYIQNTELTHNDLDSITVTNPKVDNNEAENFRVYFK
ncbi:MAG: hypothetical protein HUJ99_01720 [Bacteroidaceae bacterium]|nr:hypothetical protein [Bacteroidaceae bacterium]